MNDQVFQGSKQQLPFIHAARAFHIGLFFLMLMLFGGMAQAQVATPVLSPSGGIFPTITNVQVTCATSGATLYYTTDGTDPTTNSAQVPASGLITVGRNQMIKVKAFSGASYSSTATGTYTIPGSLICGENIMLALRFDERKVWAWGENTYGQLGNGTTTDGYLPAQVCNSATVGDYLTGVAMIAGGLHHSLALKSDGTVWAWGINNYGQLGNGTTANQLYPGQVLIAASTPLSGIAQIASTWDFSAALKASDGSIWIWGRNDSEQAGNTNLSTPVTLAQKLHATGSTYFTGAISIATGGAHGMALKADGTVWVWGSNTNRQFGNSSNTSNYGIYPVQVPGLSGIVAISAGNSCCFALDSSGYVWAWGVNEIGELGNGSTSAYVATPAKMKTSSSAYLSGVTAIAGGYRHVLMQKSDGTVWACGYGGSGQIAYNGSHSSSSYAIPVRAGVVNGQQVTFTNSISVSAGQSHSAILKPDGTEYVWGDNSHGQIGNNSTTGATNPVNIVTANFPELGNHSPSVTLGVSSGPYYQTGTITLTAAPTDPEAITGVTTGLGRLDFYDGTTLLSSLSSSPWSIDVQQPVLGSHSYSVQAIDEVGASASSSPAAVNVDYDPTLDTDGDGIPDVWEMAHGLNINDPTDANADADGDGLSNLQEYLLGLDPSNPDVNVNGIPDGQDDSNGDGIPDEYEYKSGDPAVPLAPTYIVDADGGGDFRDVQSAIDAVTADYQSIQVNDGTYSGLIAIYGHKILIYSKNGAAKTMLALNGESAGLYVATDSLVRGFGIRDGIGDRNSIDGTGGNIFIDTASPKFERCVISQGQADDGAALINNYGHPVLVNCTITDNEASNSAIYSWGYPVVLNDCILWNPNCTAEAGGVGITAHKSIVRGGGIGDNIDVDPHLGHGGHLLAGSPAIDAAASDASIMVDMDGEGFRNQPDIGADEYWDSDGDGLPDWWEKLNADAGLNFNDPTDASTDPDGDGATMLDDYQSSSQNDN